MTEPLTLPCGHSFCSKCLRAKLERGGTAEGYVVCALCTTPHQISLKNLGDYFDRPLAEHIGLLSRGADAKPVCQWCEEATASLFCDACQYTLCGECNVAVHKNRAKKDHQPMPIQDSRAIKGATRKCGVRGHEEYKLEFYCQQCEQLCCAYCLQIGPHRSHDSVLVSKAAADVRQQLGRDLENLAHLKTRIEGMANELNRVGGQFLDSYDHVESMVADRFAAFRQQLGQKEFEVRKVLQQLRDMGDRSLAESRANYLQKLDGVNHAAIAFRKLQHGGADYEVLQNRTAMNAFMQMDVPPVSGTGFRIPDPGALMITGLEVTLDLNARGDEAPPGRAGAAAASRNSQVGSARGAPGGGYPQQPPFRWTFAPDADVEFREVQDGLLCRCSEGAGEQQIGIRTNETFDAVRAANATEGDSISWRVRLDGISDSFIGVVDGTGAVPEGFYWRPMRGGQHDGRIGRATNVLRSLPACRTGDVLRFTYEYSSRSLKLAINNSDRGVIVTDVPPSVAPCFIFRPSEQLTLLLV
jgi:hypothetical protein